MSKMLGKEAVSRRGMLQRKVMAEKRSAAMAKITVAGSERNTMQLGKAVFAT